MATNTATKTVHEIGLMSFAGNVIPHTWYQHITKKTKHRAGNGDVKEIERPYLEAIVILSDIIYWYRPQILRDETTGQIISVNRRFKADKLQRSYQQLADMFGLGKEQARAAVKHLEDAGLITAELRTLVVQGTRLNNVLYLEPVPKAIARINTPMGQLTDRVLSDDAHPPCELTDTNTENSPENTQKNHNAPVGAVSEKQSEQPDILDFHNGAVPEQKEPEPAEPLKMDAVSHIVEQAKRKQEDPLWWLKPGTDCGDHDYLQAYHSFCAVIQREPDKIGQKKTLQWLRQFEKIARVSEDYVIPPGILARSIRAIRDDWNFTNKRWTTPFSAGFADLVELTASQIDVEEERPEPSPLAKAGYDVDAIRAAVERMAADD